MRIRLPHHPFGLGGQCRLQPERLQVGEEGSGKPTGPLPVAVLPALFTFSGGTGCEAR